MGCYRNRIFFSNFFDYLRFLKFRHCEEAFMPTKLKARTYGLLFALVGAIAATGGSFTVR